MESLGDKKTLLWTKEMRKFIHRIYFTGRSANLIYYLQTYFTTQVSKINRAGESCIINYPFSAGLAS